MQGTGRGVVVTDSEYALTLAVGAAAPGTAALGAPAYAGATNTSRHYALSVAGIDNPEVCGAVATTYDVDDSPLLGVAVQETASTGYHAVRGTANTVVVAIGASARTIPQGTVPALRNATSAYWGEACEAALEVAGVNAVQVTLGFR